MTVELWKATCMEGEKKRREYDCAIHSSFFFAHTGAVLSNTLSLSFCLSDSVGGASGRKMLSFEVSLLSDRERKRAWRVVRMLMIKL